MIWSSSGFGSDNSQSRSTSRRSSRSPGFFRAGETGRTSSSGSSTTSPWARLRRCFGRLSDATVFLISTSPLPALGTIITLTALRPSRSAEWSLLSLLLMMWTLSFFVGRFIEAKQRLESCRRWEERLPGLLGSATRPYRSHPFPPAAGDSFNMRLSGPVGDDPKPGWIDTCYICHGLIYPEQPFSSNWKGLSNHQFCEKYKSREDS